MRKVRVESLSYAAGRLATEHHRAEKVKQALADAGDIRIDKGKILPPRQWADTTT